MLEEGLSHGGDYITWHWPPCVIWSLGHTVCPELGCDPPIIPPGFKITYIWRLCHSVTSDSALLEKKWLGILEDGFRKLYRPACLHCQAWSSLLGCDRYNNYCVYYSLLAVSSARSGVWHLHKENEGVKDMSEVWWLWACDNAMVLLVMVVNL